MKNNYRAILILSLLLLLTTCTMAIAGPGGKIASKVSAIAFKTFWGKVALTLLVIFFLPIILYDSVVLKLAEWRARRDLRFMAAYDLRFEWLNIKERATDCFTRTHAAWQDENLEVLAGWVTDWYRQNQQMVYLDKWRDAGLKNICEVKRITEIKPILFLHRNDGKEHEGSKIVISITAYMKDYLISRDEDSEAEPVEGQDEFYHIETLWSFTLTNGMWQVSNIEEAIQDKEYAELFNKLPKIKDTVMITGENHNPRTR